MMDAWFTDVDMATHCFPLAVEVPKANYHQKNCLLFWLCGQVYSDGKYSANEIIKWYN